MAPILAAIEMRWTGPINIRPASYLAMAALLAIVAAAAAGCQTTQTTETTGALPIASVDPSDPDGRHAIEILGQQYRADSGNVQVALRYAQALRAAGQRAQAVAVLEKASIEQPHDKAVLGTYGRALAEAGNYEQALEVLDRAHSPDQPDWRILSAQGAVLDQMPSTRSIRACGRTLRSSSACKAASPRRRPSRVPTCRQIRPPPTSPICGKCWRTAKTCARKGTPAQRTERADAVQSEAARY